MFDRCLREFDRQASLAAIQRPKYDPERREKIRRDYRQKLSIALDLGLITEHNAAVLRVGHSYRNAAYHRDSHNPRVSGLFGRILLSTTVQLFADYFDIGITVGGVNEGWLAAYGIESRSFSLARASSAIAAKLKQEMETPLDECMDAFEEDIRERVAAIEQRIARLGLPSPEYLDEGLKRAEFQERFPQEMFFAELHELHYRIVKKEGKKVTPKQYQRVEKATNDKLEAAIDNFTSTASLATLQAVKHSRRLAKSQSIAALLKGYEDLDNKLDCLEIAMDSVEEALDKAAEYAEDQRRGK